MKTILLLSVSAFGLYAQPINATALNGKYHFIQMAILGSETGRPIETQTLGGDITFDGAGGYQLISQRGVGPGDAAAYEATGAYTVSTTGVIVFTDPANTGAKLSARLGADGAILTASSIDAEAMRGLFIAVRAPDWQDGPPEVHLTGNYAGASFLLPDGSIDALTTAFVELNADGAGRFSTVAATGQSSNQKNLTTRQAIAAAQYSLRSDGGGSVTFSDSAALFGGSRQIFVSPGGEILLGFSPDRGCREILVAVRRSTPTPIADWSGNWWINELLADNEIAGAVRLESSLGGLEPDGTGSVRLSQRLSTSEPWRDVTAVNYAAGSDDGSAQLGPFLEDGKSNLAIGSTAFVSAEVGAAGSNHRVHGLLFGVRASPAPDFAVRNAASLAPAAAPLSPAELVTLKGAGLANNAASVRVTINGTASALIGVTPDQINLQAPASLDGDSAIVAVRQGDAAAKTVTVALSQASPGIFTQNGSGAGLGAISHLDGTLVSGDSPAAAGETVTVLVTGLRAPAPAASLQAYIGEYPAAVLSVDAVPAMAGVYSVQLVVPAQAPSGNTAPLAFGNAGALTSMVDIAIK